MKIRKKIFLTYLLLLVITIFVSFGSFKFLSQSYLIRETKKQLNIEGKLIVNTYKNAKLTDKKVIEKILNSRGIEVAKRIINANIIILDNNKDIVFSNLNIQNKREVLTLLKHVSETKEYVAVRLPIQNNNNQVKGSIILFTRIKDIKNLNSLMFGTQLLSFLIATIIALLIGFVMGNHLTKPLRKLRNMISDFSLHKDNKVTPIRTGDEIEDLSVSFENMANKLKTYDQKQRSFLQNVSHELKTPLMSIQGNAEAIKEGVVEGEEIDESLAIIIDESQRLKKIVEELIYLTKLENISDNFKMDKVSIKMIIEGAIKSVKSIAMNKGISIIINGELDVIGDFDQDKLKRAFINLIGNGIHYAKKTITMAITKNENHTLAIKIADDGDGITVGEETKIFDRFYKGENGGTGIGLAIVKAIIEAHGGTIEAYNNNGAIFKIIIPISHSTNS